jgi:hypothetical protein
MNEPEYVAAVLAAYVALPDTACRPRPADRALAHQLFADGIALAFVLDALLLAHARRHLHPGAPPQPVRSLTYFLPVIRELSTVDPAALAWLRDSLQRRGTSPTDPTPPPPTTGPTA